MKSNRFTVAQLKNVWDQVDEEDDLPGTTNTAYECCGIFTDGTPAICLPKDESADCGEYPNIWGEQFTVGKLWSADPDYDVTVGLVDSVLTLYGTDKRNNFRDKGDAAGVNH